MTDKELLEMAAKAADIAIVGLVDTMIIQPDHRKGGFIIRNERGGDSLWNPLTDDGDALRLAVKLDICVEPYSPESSTVAYLDTTVHTVGNEVQSPREWFNGDPYAATRRAIVRAAASIGKTK